MTTHDKTTHAPVPPTAKELYAAYANHYAIQHPNTLLTWHSWKRAQKVVPPEPSGTQRKVETT